VIRQSLDMMDMGQMTLDIKQLAKDDEQKMMDDSDQPVPVDKAISSIGIAPETAKMLESFGLVQPVKTANGRCYSSTDVKLMVIAREMAKYGIEPRHLRMYTSLAEKESALFQQILLPMTRHKGEDRLERIKEVLENLSDLSDQLKTLLLQKKVKDYLQIT
jgi:DNA-binding transcriptional MerR regulator